jgi:hydrogenase maturation protease
MVAERVRKLGVPAEICTGESSTLIEVWSRADDVVVVDAAVTGAPLGSTWLWDAQTAQIQGSLPMSTHGFGVAEAIKLARVLDRLPKRLRVFGIEGRRFDLGGEISPEVVGAIEEVVKLIVAESAQEALRCLRGRVLLYELRSRTH